MKCCFLVSRPSCLGNVVFGKGAGIFLTYCIRAIASVCSGIFFLQILTARRCPLSSLVKYIPIHKYYKLFRCNFKNALIEKLRKEGFIYCFLWAKRDNNNCFCTLSSKTRWTHKRWIGTIRYWHCKGLEKAWASPRVRWANHSRDR